MVFIPRGTDAPLYHAPIITLLLIALNVGIFLAPPVIEQIQNPPVRQRDRLRIMQWIIDGGYNGPQSYELEFGQGIKPWQGITASFLHANIIHLFGNMLFLLIFGMIVEGKVGGWFLPIYLGIAFARGIFLQLLAMTFNPGMHAAALGASGIIFGIMAIALVWAPLNSIQVTLLVSKYRIGREVDDVDVPIYVMSGLFLMLDVVFSLVAFYKFGTFTPLTPVLHLTGAVFGVAVGIAMLKWNLVDCENWDVFSVLAGNHQKPADDIQESNEESQRKQIEDSLKQIREILADGDNPQLAYQAHVRMSRRYEQWDLPEKEFLTIIKQLCEQSRDRVAVAVAAMEEYLKKDRPRQNQVRLKLAELLLDSHRQPAQALKTLIPVAYHRLNTKEQGIYDRISTEAKSQYHSRTS